MSLKYFVRGGEDHIEIEIDSDHDGSIAWEPDMRRDDIDQKAQRYFAVPLRHETSRVGLGFLENYFEDESWWGYPPYGDGGGSVAGENPVVWVTEFYATPFDRLIRREPGKQLGLESWLPDRLSGFECPSAISMSRLSMGRVETGRASFTRSATTSG